MLTLSLQRLSEFLYILTYRTTEKGLGNGMWLSFKTDVHILHVHYFFCQICVSKYRTITWPIIYVLDICMLYSSYCQFTSQSINLQECMVPILWYTTIVGPFDRWMGFKEIIETYFVPDNCLNNV